MGYYDDVNELLNFSKQMVNQINHIKMEDTGLEDFQYLAFAGMISYYGMERLDDVYLAFLNVKFVNCSSTKNILDSRYNLSEDQANTIIYHSFGTFYEVDGIKNLTTGKYKFARTIYVADGAKLVPSALIKSMIHQVNHVVNSIHNPVVIKDKSLVARMGISFDEFSSRNNSFLGVEETINGLQTDEIISRLVDFSFYRIEDKKADDLLDEVALDFADEHFYKDVEEECTPTGALREIIKPLYDNKWFNGLLVERRISGKVKGIRSEFDLRTNEGGYDSLLIFCDKIFKGEVVGEERLKSEECAKMLVKKYIDSCSNK